mgnify:CR=1 FL=1
MSDVQPATVGEVGGMVALLGMVGATIKWLWSAAQKAGSTRSAKLDRWHEELSERERALDEKLNARMSAMEAQVKDLGGAVDRWRMAFQLVAAEMLQINPRSRALLQAQRILAEVYSVDFTVPADMEAALHDIGQTENPAREGKA